MTLTHVFPHSHCGQPGEENINYRREKNNQTNETSYYYPTITQIVHVLILYYLGKSYRKISSIFMCKKTETKTFVGPVKNSQNMKNSTFQVIIVSFATYFTFGFQNDEVIMEYI